MEKRFIRRAMAEFEKGNSNISTILEFFREDEQTVGRLTEIMADDYEIENDDKVAENIISIYIKEKLKNSYSEQ